MAAAWNVDFTAGARRELKALESQARATAIQVILDLAEDPVPPDAVALRGYKNLYRVRCFHDRLRVVCHISERSRKLIVTRIRPRGTAYIGMRG